MKKFSTIFIAFLSIALCAFVTACSSSKYKVSEIPQTMTGYMKVQDNSEDFRFYFCDINHNFVAYIDTSEVITSSFDRLINKPVVLRGRLAQTPKGKVIFANNIKLSGTR